MVLVNNWKKVDILFMSETDGKDALYLRKHIGDFHLISLISDMSNSKYCTWARSNQQSG